MAKISVIIGRIYNGNYVQSSNFSRKFFEAKLYIRWNVNRWLLIFLIPINQLFQFNYLFCLYNASLAKICLAHVDIEHCYANNNGAERMTARKEQRKNKYKFSVEKWCIDNKHCRRLAITLFLLLFFYTSSVALTCQQQVIHSQYKISANK